MDERFAPKGAIWVCGACGKTHADLYGLEGVGSRGWDESCALNAILCDETTLVKDDCGRIVRADPFKPVERPAND